jgi:hypothetical protein
MREAVLMRSPEKISEEKWILHCMVREELYIPVTREICPEVELLERMDKVIIKMSDDRIMNVKLKGKCGYNDFLIGGEVNG